MRKLFSILFLPLCILFAVSCQKIDGPSDDIFDTWEVKEFVSPEYTDYYRNADTPIFIRFNDNTSYSLQLETNSCNGEIWNISELRINMEFPACTEMCCDSPFSNRFSGLLPYVSMYKVTGNTLRLYVKDWGFIECIRQSD